MFQSYNDAKNWVISTPTKCLGIYPPSHVAASNTNGISTERYCLKAITPLQSVFNYKGELVCQQLKASIKDNTVIAKASSFETVKKGMPTVIYWLTKPDSLLSSAASLTVDYSAVRHQSVIQYIVCRSVIIIIVGGVLWLHQFSFHGGGLMNAGKGCSMRIQNWICLDLF